MTWPTYSKACREAMDALLAAGGPLTAYRANPRVGPEPREGSYAWRLERELERRFRVKHAVVVNSGTAALHCALFGVGVRGREVVTSPLTFSATAAAVAHAGGVPIFADVDPDTYCLSAKTVKRVITRKTAAILPVHLFGRLAPTGELASLGLPVVEDACQAVGCFDAAGYSGTVGAAGAYSFGSSKQVPAGEAGAVVTNSDAVAWTARLLMNHAENFGVGYVGYNYRPSELVCLVALFGLNELKDGTQFAEPYLVEKRGPEDFPYISKTIDSYLAFDAGKCPVAKELAERTLCVRY